VRIKVKLFASFAQAAGWRQRDMELAAGACAGDVLAELRRGPLLALPAGARPLLAVNREHVTSDRGLADGDEVAVFPPVSGGGSDPLPTVVTTEPLDPRALAKAVAAPWCGAVVTFEGTVRDHGEGHAVRAIEYDAYPEMAQGALLGIREEVGRRWPHVRLAMAHRTGRLEVGEPSVVVAAAAAHRRDAFAACRLAMDRIKEALPIWKREELASGASTWV
jgi:molybdopterin synthase catalytic subunit